MERGDTLGLQVYVRKGNVKYNVIIDRKISIIRGDSGTGKSLICDFIEQSDDAGSKIIVKCNDDTYDVVNLTSQMYKHTDVSSSKNVIYFIDELSSFLQTDDFATEVLKSNSLFVVITRKTRSLSNLPYSIHALYKFVEEKGVVTNKPDYQEEIFLPIRPFKPNYYVSEDSKSSMFLMRRLINKGSSANGNSSITNTAVTALKNTKNKVLVLADGAAFGAFVKNLLDLYIACEEKCVLGIFLPESYEWLLLHLSVFSKDADVQKALSNPDITSDSYERFYTDACKKAFAKLGVSYDKGKDILTDAYVSELKLQFTDIEFS